MINLLNEIPNFEDNKTISLFEEFDSLNNQDFLSKEQILKILMWKSPRPKHLYYSNSEEDVNEITYHAFKTDNDSLKIHILTALKGVSYPAASAILMFHNPTKFAVIDIRVWRQLYKAKLVDSNPTGQNFSLKECELFYQVIRKLASEMNLTARQVEKRIFDYDRKTQEGNLYK
jgi:thermostable 8-oxoguanine DNA glycosylase